MSLPCPTPFNQSTRCTKEPWHPPQLTGPQQEVTWQTRQAIRKDTESLHPAARPPKHHDSYAGVDDEAISIFTVFLQYLDQHVGRANFNGKSSNSTSIGSQQWHYWQLHQRQFAMHPNRCQCWIIAIIQQSWDMAWDLLPHWNVETHGTWARPTDSCPCPIVDFRSNIWPKYPFLHRSIPSRLDTPHVTTVQISDGLLNSSPADLQSRSPAVKLRSPSHSTQWCNPIGSETMLNP